MISQPHIIALLSISSVEVCQPIDCENGGTPVADSTAGNCGECICTAGFSGNVCESKCECFMKGTSCYQTLIELYKGIV